MKILIFSDVHIHPHKRSTDRLDDCVRVLDWVFNSAKENGIKNIVFLGDLFHDRQKIDVLTYQRTFEVMEKNLDGNTNLFLLLGNHDIWHNEKTDVSSVNPLRNMPGVRVIGKPSVHEISEEGEKFHFAFLPYTHNPIEDLKDIESEWDRLCKTDQAKVLGGHISVDGAFLNTRYNTVADVTIEHDGDMVKVGPGIFESWDRVFLGHYHAEQKLNDKVEYVGSPLQLSFGEAFQKKHIIVLETKDLSVKYIENDFSPKHFIIGQNDIDSYDLDGSFVRLEVDDIASTEMIEIRDKLISESKVSTLEIKQTPKKEDHTISDATAILQKEEEMIQKYVDQVASEELDKNLLVKIGTEICSMGDAE
jgi:DNA repair exonuclease SbcCD nuclease subunit